MNRLALWLANRLARLLEPADRDALLGDQSEIGMPGLRAAREAFGLLVRRKLLSRSEGLGNIRWWYLIPTCAVLVVHSIRLARALEGESLRWPLSPHNWATCMAVVVIVSSWTSGYLIQLLTSPESRTTATAGTLSVWLTPLAAEAAHSGIAPSVLLIHGAICVLPFVAGLLRGGNRNGLPISTAAVLTAVPLLIIVWLIANWQRGSGDGSISPMQIYLGVILLFTAYPGALLLWLFRRKRSVDPSPSSEAAS